MIGNFLSSKTKVLQCELNFNSSNQTPPKALWVLCCGPSALGRSSGTLCRAGARRDGRRVCGLFCLRVTTMILLHVHLWKSCYDFSFFTIIRKQDLFCLLRLSQGKWNHLWLLVFIGQGHRVEKCPNSILLDLYQRGWCMSRRCKSTGLKGWTLVSHCVL
jgi:hypothetical protein